MGKKKHKKKTYTTPKKLKHVHQKKSLSSFIASQNNQKCNQCMSILANHEDRLYCGSCHYSIVHNSCMQQETE